MTLVDYISGLFGPSGGPQQSRTGAVCREPSGPDPDVDESRPLERGPPYVYECRRCGTTVTAETSVCPHCDRSTIAEYPVR